MKRTLLIILVNIFVFNYLAAQNCSADFTHSTDSTFLVSFQNTSETYGNPICSYLWNFGDGTSSTEENPSHQFAGEGQYTVCLDIQVGEDASCNNIICSDSICVEITIASNCNMSLSFTQVNVSTVGGDDGSIDLTVNNATSFVTYQWNTGQTTEDLSGLIAGEYSVLVSDTNACEDSLTVYITEPNCNMSLSFTQVNVSTVGGSDGSIDLSVSNASAPFTFQWNTGQTTEDLSGLIAGEYSVIVSDQMACEDSVTIVVSEPNIIPEYSLTGHVYAKTALLPQGVALLVNNENIMVAKTEIIDGYYSFLNIDSAEYSIYAVPYFNLDYEYFPIYFPTYFGDNKFWQSLSFVLVDSVRIADIHLNYYEEILHGQAFLSGQVQFEAESEFEISIYQQNWFSNFRLLNTNAAPNVTVFLLDQNNQVLDFCLSDENGFYRFDKVPFGTYQVYVEKSGKTTIPVWATLSENNDTIENLNLTIKWENIISVPKVLPQKDSFTIYPNPFVDIINISQSSKLIDVSIFDITGRLLSKQNFNNQNKIEINTNNLQKGTYIISCKTSGNVGFEKIMIKK